MQELEHFYINQISKHQTELSNVKKQLFVSSMIRLAIFCAAILGVYFVYGNTRLVLGVVLVAIILFLVLVNRHSNLQYAKNLLVALIEINEVELKVLKRDFHDLPAGDEFKNGEHYYSQDIDLFGKGSFYQYANRTTLTSGSQSLASILTNNHIDRIEEKQEAIKELAQTPEWRQHFSATASLTKTETSTKFIASWLKSYKYFVPSYMKFLPLVFSIGSVILFTLYFLDVIPESLLLFWFVVGFAITGAYTKNITGLVTDASKLQSTFQQYQKLLSLLEEKEFSSSYLNEFKKEMKSNGEVVSKLISKFSASLNSLDRNNNLIYLILANGFFLRTLHHCFHLEKWMRQHGDSVEKWFETVAKFDAYNSLGNFAFNHPNYSYPNVNESQKVVLASKNAGHPLLNPEKMVLNDFQIAKEHFFIITGANMAGKSTFLRTVSLQIVMANAGLPLCADEVSYSPIKLITSMRTTDSLTDDESYFFSELKRLKFIVNEIQKDQYFIVLDEILKGTNSTDKAEGSRKFVERLVNSKATGIIATHDLSLCEVAEEMPEVENHYFDAEIVDNELHFDYRFKKGICQNMNASFLLKKMEIVE
ncbi:DNA mismatch repair protein MutS [Cytophaga sp. FL35]|uniref:MutS-related protein n=1 Tax=Cytophaga sp. FL35 TaxID=1904456 RepID=UPI001653D517|nr:DNA mismatch repair protein MutS [Cytophaga sp. FL35]MBC6997225.1 DNA mismatch repair protein MutS [Cytophaga sp. FL35]